MARHEIAALLPEILREADRPASPFRALLEAMAGLADLVDREIDGLDAQIDPRRCRDRMLGMLLGWLDLGPVAGAVARHVRDPALRDARLRRLALAAPALLPRRGTQAGLRDMLAAASGLEALRLRESLPGPGFRPFHVVIEYPRRPRPVRALIRDVAELEKPVFVSFEIVELSAPEHSEEGA
ncbi:hypothetical protein CCR90_18470 [Rhodovulum sulfidophilum]|uniref:hypothetical protein n=1 Tax=Rhodovulum sulfidophilum TaxID=35806 RepID=UPI00191442E6|nr:hypothetical protein [Rhodovulum sulfidophilum]MBK5925707.1 hypothetical protein [Rhodovulum sulfidophilum]